MGRVKHTEGIRICVDLYAYATSRIGQPQDIKDTTVVESFITTYENIEHKIDRTFILNYMAWQFSRWVDMDMRIMPNMIFGTKAILKFKESDDWEINWDGLKRFGIIHSQMIEKVGVEEISLMNRGEFDKMTVSRGEPMRCLVAEIKEGDYCKECKSYKECLVVESH